MIEVYYIEDDEDIALTVKEYLGQQGCSVSVLGTVENGKKALEHHVPSIALIEWNLPDGSGDMLCRWIRARWKELPVIFLTVRGDTRDIVFGFENGADDYVEKPFELEILYSRISAVLRRTGDVLGQYLTCGPVRIVLFVLSVRLIATALSTVILTDYYNRMQFQAFGDFCSELIEKNSDDKRTILEVLKTKGSRTKVSADENILTSFGYQQSDLMDGRVTIYLTAGAGFAAGGSLFLFAFWYWHKKSSARIKMLTVYLAKINAGGRGGAFGFIGR